MKDLFDDDYETSFDSWKGGGKKYQAPKRCFETHPALPIGKHKVYGGSCSRPIVLDADVYIGLDHSMSFSGRAQPWAENRIEEVQYLITDMSVPKDVAGFKKMIDWLAQQVEAEKKVHVGCIGGHGRTGTVYAALVAVMTGEADAIEYVRTNYCKKAVESDVQISWLGKHFGIKSAKPSKGGYSGFSGKSKRKQGSFYGDTKKARDYKMSKNDRAATGGTKKEFVIRPMGSKACMFGEPESIVI